MSITLVPVSLNIELNIIFTVLKVEFDDMPCHKINSKIKNFTRPLNWIIVILNNTKN